VAPGYPFPPTFDHLVESRGVPFSFSLIRKTSELDFTSILELQREVVGRRAIRPLMGLYMECLNGAERVALLAVAQQCGLEAVGDNSAVGVKADALIQAK
jgi:hypothetical protein